MRPIIGIPCATQKPESELGSGGSIAPQSYIRALEGAGASPILIPITDQESTLRSILNLLDGLLLCGGVDVDPVHFGEPPHPKLGEIDAPRDWVELTITRWALAEKLPILGICRGIQVLNVACGGPLWQDIESQAPDALPHQYVSGNPYSHLSHPVKIEPNSLLSRILGEHELMVNSLHHQAVKTAGQGLVASAHSPDGLIEGVDSSTGNWVVGVQWHPEWLLENVPAMKKLFAEFALACSGSSRGVEP